VPDPSLGQSVVAYICSSTKKKKKTIPARGNRNTAELLGTNTASRKKNGHCGI
jgi:hypothetical protein